MPFLNVYMSLGWVGDERIVSIELPESFEEWSEPSKQEFIYDETNNAVETTLEYWTDISDEAAEN